MCIYKAPTKGIFNKSLYLEMRFWRTCVNGFLNGLSPPVNDIDNLIGFVPEVIYQDDGYSVSVQNEDHSDVLPS